MLRAMVDESTLVAVIEATSHGLSPRTSRLRHVPFHTAVFTNLTHEHLEYHGTMDRYRSDKANLFRALVTDRAGREPLAVLNTDDPSWRYFADQTPRGSRICRFSLTDPAADAFLVSAQHSTENADIVFRLLGEEVSTSLPLPGDHNIQNLLAAALVAVDCTGASPARLAELCPRLKPVPGRLDPVLLGHPYRVWVDFAHTPDAFE